ncbi:hypothetical protein UPYG_G00258180 [Umbra pygmaea]|uniref:Uncharacterized protein n=1 Tax=Umbra pygmaea TaxID=75934 RepID=A0ABD0W8Q4_UMBPY
MASPRPSTSSMEPSSKRQRTELYGYIHHVSPVKSSQSKKPYFTATFQEENEYRKLVVFNNRQHASFKAIETNRSPVKISNPRLAPGLHNQQEISVLVNSSTNVDIIQAVSFAHDANTLLTNSQMTLADILASSTQHHQVNVTVFIQAMREEQQKWVPRERKEMDMTKYAVADNTASLHLSTWGNMRLLVNNWYDLENISTRIYNGTVSLTTTPATIAKLTTQPTQAPVTEPIADDTVTFSGEVIGASVKSQHTCPQNHTLTDINTAAQTTSCPSCDQVYKTSKVRQVFTATLTIELPDNTLKTVQLHNKIILNALTSNLTTNSSSADIEMHFLHMDAVTIKAEGNNALSLVPATPPITLLKMPTSPDNSDSDLLRMWAS